MTVVTIHTAKTNLSKLLSRMEAGEEIVIARGKTPVARLAPVEQAVQAAPEAPMKRQPGRWTGMIEMKDNYFEPDYTEEDFNAWLEKD